jgi:tetratricopeptide (TPR) repeat protein
MIIKYFLIAFSLIFFVSCSTSQNYSIKNKKAIKLFEQGKAAPSQSIDKQAHTPNYKEGIRLMEKAIEKDTTFWEAHMFAGEMCELIRNYPSAIEHYKKALKINPQHSSTGSTYFFLANLQHAVGDYENAIKNIDLFQIFQNANPDLVKNSHKIRANCVFAKESMDNPLDFNPINIGPGINTADPEYFPTITVDGKTILFTRRIADNRVYNPIKEQEDFYISQLSNNDIWQTAITMPSNVNTLNNEGAPTISADGRSLVFVACPDVTGTNYGENRNGRGSCDLFYTKKLGNKWSNPVNLPGAVNTFAWESQPSLAADGKTMYFIRRVSRRGEKKKTLIYCDTFR